MKRLTRRDRNFDGSGIANEPLINRATNSLNDYASEIITKLAEYEDLEDILNGISLKEVVDGFIKAVEGQTHEGYEHGRILTNAEAEKWNEYKQLEEQSLLLQLPCKIGDKVYIILTPYFDIESFDAKYAEAEIRDFTHFKSCGFCVVVTSKVFGKLNIPFSDFNKNVFFTKEEAEQKLKEMENK